MHALSSIDADVVALDKDGKPVALVEVKATEGPTSGALTRLSHLLGAASPQVQFGILVDLRTIQVFRYTGGPVDQPDVTLLTGSILSAYDPDFERKRIFSDYLGTLVEAWLSDLAYHWKWANPPGQSDMASIGLTQLLSGGETLRQYAGAA